MASAAARGRRRKQIGLAGQTASPWAPPSTGKAGASHPCPSPVWAWSGSCKVWCQCTRGTCVLAIHQLVHDPRRQDFVCPWSITACVGWSAAHSSLGPCLAAVVSTVSGPSQSQAFGAQTESVESLDIDIRFQPPTPASCQCSPGEFPTDLRLARPGCGRCLGGWHQLTGACQSCEVRSRSC